MRVGMWLAGGRHLVCINRTSVLRSKWTSPEELGQFSNALDIFSLNCIQLRTGEDKIKLS